MNDIWVKVETDIPVFWQVNDAGQVRNGETRKNIPYLVYDPETTKFTYALKDLDSNHIRFTYFYM